MYIVSREQHEPPPPPPLNNSQNKYSRILQFMMLTVVFTRNVCIVNLIPTLEYFFFVIHLFFLLHIFLLRLCHCYISLRCYSDYTTHY